MNNLSDVQKDMLREFGNIGIGNAATSLSEILQKKVSMDVPSVHFETLHQIIETAGRPEQVVVAIIFQIKGEAPGTLYFMMSLQEAEMLVQEILHHPIAILDKHHKTHPLASSVLQEIGNILTGSYLTALSDFTKINMRSSIPYLGIDMTRAIMVDGLLELSEVVDQALIIDTKMSCETTIQDLSVHFLFIPTRDTFTKIFYSLGYEADE